MYEEVYEAQCELLIASKAQQGNINDVPREFICFGSEDLESDAVLDLQFRAAGNLQNDQPVVLRKVEDGKVNAVVTTTAVRTGLSKLMKELDGEKEHSKAAGPLHCCVTRTEDKLSVKLVLEVHQVPTIAAVSAAVTGASPYTPLDAAPNQTAAAQQ